MELIKLKVNALECKRCLHRWIPRTGRKPKFCPKCNSPYWDRRRQKEVMADILKKYL